jgi:hypothetical protein
VHRDFAYRFSQGTRCRDARVRCRRLRAGDLGEEERGDAIADVPSHHAAGVDDALVRGCNEAASQREVVRGGQATREHGRVLEIGEQHGTRSSPCLRELLHPCDMTQIASGHDGRQDRGPDRGFDDQCGPHASTALVVHAQPGPVGGHHPSAKADARYLVEHRLRIGLRRDLIDEVA